MDVHAAFAALMGRPLVADPFALYDEIRRLAPVHREPNGIWYLTRHADCEALLRSPRFGHQGTHTATHAPIDSPRARLLSKMFSFDDPPVHTRKRALFAPPFTAKASEAYPPVIRRIVGELLDEAVPPGATRVDIDAIAAALPVRVTCELLGIPAADRAQCIDWVDALTSANQPIPLHEIEARANAAVDQTVVYFGDLLARRRREPTTDLLSTVAAATAGADWLDADDIVANVIMLMAAGFETIRYTIAGGVVELAKDSSALASAHAQIERNGELDDLAVEEILRRCGPIHAALGRRSNVDEVVAGITIPAGEAVMAMVAAANHDPAAYEEPYRLDLSRSAARPLAFGHGPHYCLGAILAKQQINLALTGLLTRLPSLGEVEQTSAKGSFNVRGTTGVVLRLG